MWSLCTEVAFYVLLPALVALLLWRAGDPARARARVFAGLVVLTVAGFAWQTVAAASSNVVGQHYHQWLPGFMPWFAVGMLFAVASVHAATPPDGSPWRWFERAARDLPGCWLVATAVFAVACTPVAGPRLLITPSPDEALAKSVLYTVSAAFFVLPLVFGPESEGWARQVASSRVAVWLGDISYGIFCLHLIALEATMTVLGVEEFTGRFWSVFLATVAITVVLAAASYYSLERRFLRLKNAGPFAPKVAAATTRPSSASS
jgi:peptidoglycan/LPS O-acetylase OafA/YrhL